MKNSNIRFRSIIFFVLIISNNMVISFIQMSFKIIISYNPLVLIEYLAVSKNGEISLPIFKIVVTLYKVRKPGLRKLMWHDLIKRVCVCVCVRARAHMLYIHSCSHILKKQSGGIYQDIIIALVFSVKYYYRWSSFPF